MLVDLTKEAVQVDQNNSNSCKGGYYRGLQQAVGRQARALIWGGGPGNRSLWENREGSLAVGWIRVLAAPLYQQAVLGRAGDASATAWM